MHRRRQLDRDLGFCDFPKSYFPLHYVHNIIKLEIPKLATIIFRTLPVP